MSPDLGSGPGHLGISCICSMYAAFVPVPGRRSTRSSAPTPASQSPRRPAAGSGGHGRPGRRPSDAYWNAFAPRVEGYNGVLAKKIAASTGQLVKGIFMCSEAYASQVLCSPSVPCIMADVSVLCFLQDQRGAELFRPQSAGGAAGTEMRNQAQSGAKHGAVNKGLKR
jgi:hypothetical protein